MKINKVERHYNVITFSFYKYYGEEIIGRLLKQIAAIDSFYYYLIFGEHWGEYDLSAYTHKYPLAGEEEGLFQLEEDDSLNAEFIYKMLNSYHTACLCINKNPDFLLNLDHSAWRTFYPSSDGGYVIDMLTDYINIRIGRHYSDWTPEFIQTTLGLEIMEPVPVTFPVFIFDFEERSEASEEEKTLRCIMTDEKKFKQTRGNLINSNYFTHKTVIDSSGNIYRIARTHTVGDPLIANLLSFLFFRKDDQRFYIEFEYEDEIACISLECFKEMIISIVKSKKSGCSYSGKIKECSSFEEIAQLMLRRKLVRDKWV